MEDVVATLDRLGPAVVGGEVGGEEGEAAIGAGLGPDRGPHVGLAAQIPDRGPHPVPALQQFDDAPAAEEPRPAGDQHGFRLPLHGDQDTRRRATAAAIAT